MADPLNPRTIIDMQRESGLDINQIQESVMRFARYYFSHDKIKKEIYRPIGFLRKHMKLNKQIFIEPEWWLEIQHRHELGQQRFDPTVTKEQKDKEGRAWIENYGNFFGDVLSAVEQLSA